MMAKLPVGNDEDDDGTRQPFYLVVLVYLHRFSAHLQTASTLGVSENGKWAVMVRLCV